MMSVYNKNGTQLSELYGVGGSELATAYDISGDVVFNQSEPQWDYDNYTISTLFTLSGDKMQAFSIYDGKIAQARETYALYIVDLETGTKLREVSMDFGHGNSCQFSNEFYADGDEFPLFYIRNSGIWVYRIVNTSSTLIRKYSFSTNDIGTYVAGFGVDSANKRMYTASYTEGDYQTKTGQLRICLWDMDDVTDLGNNTYTMELLDSNDFDWFTKYEAVQGCCYHDGYFFVSTGMTNSQQYVVLIGEDSLTIEHEITIGNTTEIEGCAWVNDDYMVVGQNPTNITYRKVEFATTTG